MSDSADAIAVIGYAGRFPGAADDLDEFWTDLRDGVDVHTDFSDADLDEAGVPASVRLRPDFVRSGYVLDGVADFDAEFFGLSPAEAALVDPQQRLFLECVWQVFEHAGHRPGGPVGVFAGSGLSGYLLNVLAAHRDATDLVASYQALTANDKDFLATRVSYKLGLSGPSIVVQTACSTSLVAVHLATQSLLSGECDLAVAGGVSVLLPQRAGYVHQPGMILSPDGRCRPFDAAAKGTVRGNGLGAVLLRRLDDAIADGDTVHGVILGSAVNNDGADKLGFSATSVSCQRDVVVQAHEIAGVAPDTIDYVETHGTGTDLGDPAEVAALGQAFGRGGDGTCVLGSVKANIGHLDAAAGIAGLIKVLLMLRHQQIPPLLHHDELNPKIDTLNRFQVITDVRKWHGVDGVRRAGITSLGIGGTNAHLVVEQPPAPVETTESRPVQLLTLSARTPRALDAAAARLAGHLSAQEAPELADAAYTTHVGRVRLPYRRVVRARSRSQAVKLLGADGGVVHDQTEHRHTVYLLPGQGAQRVGMGRLVHEREPVFREAFDEVTGMFAEHLGVDVRAILHGPPSTEAEQELRQTVVAQAALFSTEYALAMLLGEWGVRPCGMLGHSLGEFVAACLAGVFTLPAAVRLVARRGLLMRDLPRGEMLAVSLAEDALAPYLGAVDLAAVNGAQDCVLAGPPEAIAVLRRQLDGDRVDHRTLRTSHAFHSAAIEPILDEFAGLVRDASPRPPGVPFVSNLTGDWITAEQATDPGYWTRQARGAVRFHQGLTTLLTDPGVAVVEVGPGQALAALARRSPAHAGQPVVGTLAGLPKTAGDEHEAVLEAVGRLWTAGADIDWTGFHAEERRRRVPLPTYAFQRDRHWLDLPTRDRAPALVLDEPPARWAHAQSWRRSAVTTVAAVTKVADPTAGARHWLLVGGIGFPAGLADSLRRAGREADWIPAGADYERALRELRPDAVAQLAGLDAVAQLAGLDADDPMADALALARALHAERVPELWFVTRGLCRVESGDEVVPERTPLLGLAAVMPWELDGMACRVLDAGAGWSADAVAGELVAGGDAEPLVCHRGPFRWVPEFERVAPSGAGFREHGVYLVTGGLGRIGQRIAQWLTSRFDARVVLVGRSAAAPGGHPFVRADVADVDQLRAAFATAVERFGRVDGVIHAAGLTGAKAHASLAATTWQTLAQHFAAKVDGTRALATVLGELADPPEFCLLMSSTVSLLGGPGFGAYAAANAYLNGFAAARAGVGQTRWISASWDAWALTDGDLSEVRRAVRPDDGLEALNRLVAVPSGGHFIVSARDFAQRWREPRGLSRAEPAAQEPASVAVSPNSMQDLVRSVWQEVLGIADIDPDGNFFDFGGDSMTGLRIIRNLSDRSGVELSAVDVYEAPTVRALAELLTARVGGPAAEAAKEEVSEESQRAGMRRAALRRRADLGADGDE